VNEFEGAISALCAGRVEFILVGGLAATVHGSARATYDIDVVYSRTPENLERLATALQPLQPYLRGAPPGLPFTLDVETLRRGLNFTLTTSAGALDLLGEVAGGGSYEKLLSGSIRIELYGQQCRCVALDQLIALKRAAGRPRDLEAIAELETLREERGQD
jgi:hypothetical protein